MKLEELFEMTGVAAVAPGGAPVAVQTIGHVEYRAGNASVQLYKRNHEGKPYCVARIKRKSGQGWRFVTTKHWKSFDLPHFGNLTDAKSPYSGPKAISAELHKVMTQWGIRYEGLKKLEI